ncbi:MAG: hypothetical protein AAFP76_06475 [Bacteroidota bacterium]
MKRSTKNIVKYIIEFLIVAFGVFLGMYVSEYQSEKKTQVNKEKSLKFIIEELASNMDRLQKTLDYHKVMKQSFDSIDNILLQKDLEKSYYASTKFKHTQIKGWKGVGLVGYEDVAYESAKLSGAVQEMDIELINTISKA